MRLGGKLVVRRGYPLPVCQVLSRCVAVFATMLYALRDRWLMRRFVWRCLVLSRHTLYSGCRQDCPQVLSTLSPSRSPHRPLLLPLLKRRRHARRGQPVSIALETTAHHDRQQAPIRHML
jgi:hypothetical protein